MPKPLYVEANLFALSVLAILYLSTNRRNARYIFALRLFVLLLVSCALPLLLDMGCVLAEGLPGSGNRSLHRALNVLRYCSYPLPGICWSLYTDYQIHLDDNRFKRILGLLLLPFALSAAFAVCSLRSGLVFSIDESNIYHMGALMPLQMSFSLVYIIGSWTGALAYRRRLERRTLRALLFLPLFPFVGGILQFYFYKLPVVWMASSVMLLVIFLNIQSEQLYTDYLTGLFNRKELAIYLNKCIRLCGPTRSFSGVMIDLDNLKAINDTYGHPEGDRAIAAAAQIIRESIGPGAFAARFAGDEFIVILREQAKELEKTIAALRESVKELNARQTFPYELSLSVGYEQLDLSKWPDANEFINHIDALMYAEKRSKTDAEKKGEHLDV